MRIAIFGGGAIGSLLAARLTPLAQVTVIARGPHLAAMQARGLRLRSCGEERVAYPRAIADSAEAGEQDYVIVALKAHSLPAAAPAIARMCGTDTAIVVAVNGIPYWYFHAVEGRFRDRRVTSIDPDGTLTATLPPALAIGTVVYPAAEIVEPGVIEHGYGDRFSIGEPNGTRSVRVEKLSKLLIGAGFKAPIRQRLRDEIWVKLWGNLAFNPISALTGATLDVITRRPDLRLLCREMMLEAQGVGESLGARFAIAVDKRIDGAAEVGEHKTSMLQDLERGRPMEIDALLGSVTELADLVQQPAPICRAVLALVRQRARQAGCY